jgi:hypothetical protein
MTPVPDQQSVEDRERRIRSAKLLLNMLDDQEQYGELLKELSQGLKTLYYIQQTVSGLVPGALPEANETHASPDQIRTYFLALQVEWAELLQELPWKPWKNFKHPDLSKTSDEFADVLAFLGVALILLDSFGMSPLILARAYLHKTEVNIERLTGRTSGYDKPIIK